MSRLGRAIVVLLYAFLLAPLAVVLLTSFSNDGFLAFPPRHWGVAGLLATFTGLTLGHCLVAVPYVIRIVLTALRGIPVAVEDAAATLGAKPLQVFRRVTLPLMLPGLIAAGALAFLASFDEVVISLF